MYEDLDRIRCLETRMRKRHLIQPATENNEQDESKDPEEAEEQNSLKNNIAPKVLLHTVDVNCKDSVEVEHEDNHKKNKKLTDFFKQKKSDHTDKLSSKVSEARKNRDQRMNESTEPTINYS